VNRRGKLSATGLVAAEYLIIKKNEKFEKLNSLLIQRAMVWRSLFARAIGALEV
jgi:hypothetical protein